MASFCQLMSDSKKTWTNHSSDTVHSVRGQSGFFDLALTGRNMQVKFNLKLSVYSLDLEIWPLSFKFNFGLMGWLQQPPRERVTKFNKIVGFDDPFHIERPG